MVVSIPIDFCIEFWNSTFPPVMEFNKGTFLNFFTRYFHWCKSLMGNCFVTQVFVEANSNLTH